MPQKEITIQNTYIELKRDKNGKTYFLVGDRDTGLAYFAFPHRTKGWHDLQAKWAKVKEIWINFTPERKITALKILKLYPRFPPVSAESWDIRHKKACR